MRKSQKVKIIESIGEFIGMLLYRKLRVSLMVEWIISLYIVVANVINILHKFDVISSDDWIMEDNFWGPALLVLLVIIYLLAPRNQGTKIAAVRSCIVAVAIAGILSVRSLPLSLMLLFVMGCLLLDGRDKITAEQICCGALFTAIGIEGYSVIEIATAATQGTPKQGSLMLYSIVPDVVLLFAVILKLCVEKEKIFQIRFFPSKESILCFVGYAACLLAASLFLFYVTAINIGQKKERESAEEVYLLQHYQDTSRVLSAVKDTAGDEYILQFADYTGANNQKIRMQKMEDDLYQLVFLDPEVAISLKIVDAKHGKLTLEAPEDKAEQKWLVTETDEERSIYRISQTKDYALCYALMPEGEREDLVFGMRKSGCWEFFIVQNSLANEFLTETPIRYHDDFYPTLLMETIFTLLGEWTVVVWLLIVAGFMVIVHLRKIWGNPVALVFGAVFAWLVAYGALSVIAVLWAFISIESWMKKRIMDEELKNVQEQ